MPGRIPALQGAWLSVELQLVEGRVAERGSVQLEWARPAERCATGGGVALPCSPLT